MECLQYQEWQEDLELLNKVILLIQGVQEKSFVIKAPSEIPPTTAVPSIPRRVLFLRDSSIPLEIQSSA